MQVDETVYNSAVGAVERSVEKKLECRRLAEGIK